MIGDDLTSNDVNFSEQGKDTTFLDLDNTAILSKQKLKAINHRQTLQEYIRNNPFQSAYQISKKLNLSHGLVHGILRDLVFMQVIGVKQSFDSFNRPIEVFFIPKQAEAGQ